MKFWIITKKDLRLLVRDRRALIVLVVLPLIFITIIGLTTGKLMGWTSSNTVLRIVLIDKTDYDSIGKVPPKTETAAAAGKSDEAVVDETVAEETLDDTPLTPEEIVIEQKLTRNIVTKIFNRIQRRDGFEIKTVDTDDQARELYEHHIAAAAIIIGPDFYRRVKGLAPAEIMDRPEEDTPSGALERLDIQLKSPSDTSSTHSLIAEVVWANVFRSIAPTVLCARSLPRRFMGRRCGELDEEVEAAEIERLPRQEHAYVQNEIVYQNLIPSYTVMFVFFLVTIMARSFINERDIGTLRRLRIAPVSPTSLLAGKTVPFLIISLVQTALLFGCGRLLFGMSWGNTPVLLIPVILCTSLAATALGLLLSTLVRTESQVTAYANIVVITMAGISGCFMPRRWLPEPMQNLSLATPHAWALEAYDQLLAQPAPDMHLVVECCAMLLGFAFVYFVGGSLRFRSLD
jgi:ABC-2 type transport system permease protein